MNITSVTDEQYLAAIAQLQAANAQQSSVQTSKNNTGSDFDSYISAVSNTDSAIPSSTYGANGLETDTFTAVTGTDTDSDVSTEQESTVSGSSGAGGGGGSSDSEEETTTEIVTINGVTYLQTTTTDENGNETVTRTKIGSADTSENSTASSVNL